MTRLNAIVSFLCGLVFAIGIGIAGMAQPTKILGFLDVAGDWDPSLAFVMAGAIGVHVWFARRGLDKTKKPLLAASFMMPANHAVDARLVGGAALFGVGWGLAGYCPGPAIVSLAALAPVTIAFVVAMAFGLLVGRAPAAGGAHYPEEA
jgi:uncharacterized membrane protein YedE/YeeE